MSFIVEDNVIKAENVDFDFAELGGLGTLIFNTMKKYRNNIAQIDPETDRRDSYDYLLRHCIRTALLMQHKGIKKGEVVMGCSDNHLDACIPIIAALFLGALPCSIDPALTLLEKAEIIKIVNPKMIFAIPSQVQEIEDTCRDLKLDSEIVVFGTSDKHTEFQSFIEKQIGEDNFEPAFSKDPFETAIIYLSSGTSGLSKACCLSHAYFIMQSTLITSNTPKEHLDAERKNFEWSQIKRGGTFLSYSPLYWITGGKILIPNLFIGGTRVLCKTFNPKRFWEIVEKYRILTVFLIPYYISKLIEFGRPSTVNVESLIRIITGGTTLQVTQWRSLHDLLPDTDIVQNYGLTETGIVTGFEMYNKLHREYYKTHPNCLGYPIRGNWCKVVDLETNAALGPNQEGELLVKSKHIMNGYYNQQSTEVIDPEGWFKTGDLAYYTDDYTFYLTDRLKEVFKFQGRPTYPYIIENELYKHPAVAQAAVVGIPHEIDGDRPAAFVVLCDGFEGVTSEDLRRFADERLQNTSKLRGGLKIVKSLPMTSSGKVKRRDLRKMIVEENYE